MKKLLMIFAGALLAGTAPAAVVLSQTFDYSNQAGGGEVIAAGDPVGTVSQESFSLAGAGDRLVGLSIGLNIVGGYNGDFFAWLKSPNGTVVTLLNQPGSDMFGSPASGYGNGSANSFVLSSTSKIDIQGVDGTYGAALTGNYGAAGDLDAFGTAARPGTSANGLWTLYFDDLGSGGGSGLLKSWTLNETVISGASADVAGNPIPTPEPTYTVAGLLLFASGIVAVRSRRESA